jgi:hypothetical protein
MILPNVNIDSNGNIEDGKAYIEVKTAHTFQNDLNQVKFLE